MPQTYCARSESVETLMVPWYCIREYASQAPELGELGHSIPLLLAPTCVGAIVLERVRAAVSAANCV